MSLCCVYKKPYEHSEPWKCPECGIDWAVVVHPPQRFTVTGVIERAIELLDICASQNHWEFGARNVPGYGPRWSAERSIANSALGHPLVRAEVEWKDAYALAAQVLRTGWRPS